MRAAPGTTGDERERAPVAEAERLVATGAHVVEPQHGDPMSTPSVMMSDPEGDEFCLD